MNWKFWQRKSKLRQDVDEIQYTLNKLKKEVELLCDLLRLDGRPKERSIMKPPKLTPEDQLAFLIDKRDMCFDNMEGEDLAGFTRWESLYVAYATIVADMEKELNENSRLKEAL